MGVVAEKIDSDFWREGSEKEGEEIGLWGEGIGPGGGGSRERGEKSTADSRAGTPECGVGDCKFRGRAMTGLRGRGIISTTGEVDSRGGEVIESDGGVVSD